MKEMKVREGFSLRNKQLTVPEKLSNALDYLRTLTTIAILEDQDAFEAFFFWAYTISFVDRKEATSIITKKKGHVILSELLNELAGRLPEIDFNQAHIEIKKQEAKMLTRNDRLASLISFALYIVNMCLQKSFNFNALFARHSGLEAHLRFLRATDSTLARLADAEIIDMTDQSVGLIDYVMMNLSAMSKNFRENPHRWIDSNALDTVLKIARSRRADSNGDDLLVDAYVAIANIATDAQIEQFLHDDINVCIDLFTNMISRAADDFKIGNTFSKRETRFINEDKRVVQVSVYCMRSADGRSRSLLVPLLGLYSLAVNDTLRAVIYFDRDLKDDLCVLLLNGNDIERKYVIKLMCQLSFDTRIATDIGNDSRIMDFLNFRGADLSFQDVKIDKLKSILKWNIEQSNENSLSLQRTRSRMTKNALLPSNVFVSYDRSIAADRLTCVKVKQALEQDAGLSVHMDVRDIHVTSVHAMAHEIENASVVLMCVNERYRQSLNCQAEALYARRLGKRTIALIFEKGYENSKGWLEPFVGNEKVFINYARYTFDDCTRQLIDEIRSPTMTVYPLGYKNNNNTNKNKDNYRLLPRVEKPTQPPPKQQQQQPKSTRSIMRQPKSKPIAYRRSPIPSPEPRERTPSPSPSPPPPPRKQTPFSLPPVNSKKNRNNNEDDDEEEDNEEEEEEEPRSNSVYFNRNQSDDRPNYMNNRRQYTRNQPPPPPPPVQRTPPPSPPPPPPPKPITSKPKPKPKSQPIRRPIVSKSTGDMSSMNVPPDDRFTRRSSPAPIIDDPDMTTTTTTRRPRTLPPPPSPPMSGGRARPSSVEDWTEDDVREWLDENNIDANMARKLMPCNGRDLKKLRELKRNAPEFFFNSLKSTNNLNEIKPLLKFAEILSSLPN